MLIGWKLLLHRSSKEQVWFVLRSEHSVQSSAALDDGVPAHRSIPLSWTSHFIIRLITLSIQRTIAKRTWMRDGGVSGGITRMRLYLRLR